MSEYSKDKYYFIKLPKDFFQSYKMRALEGVPEGKNYELMYLKLICESVSHNGYLRFDPQTPYTVEMIAGITNTPIDTVRVGLSVLQRFGLIEINERDTIYLPEVPAMTTSTTEGALKKQLQRSGKGGQGVDICPPRYLRELESNRESRETTDYVNTPSSVSPYKPVATSKKQKGLLRIMTEVGFLDESETEDPQWDDLLDEFVRNRKAELGDRQGYVDAKLKVAYVLKSVSFYTRCGVDANDKPIFRWIVDEARLKGIGSKYPWFVAALEGAVRNQINAERVDEELRKMLDEDPTEI